MNKSKSSAHTIFYDREIISIKYGNEAVCFDGQLIWYDEFWYQIN